MCPFLSRKKMVSRFVNTVSMIFIFHVVTLDVARCVPVARYSDIAIHNDEKFVPIKARPKITSYTQSA